MRVIAQSCNWDSVIIPDGSTSLCNFVKTSGDFFSDTMYFTSISPYLIEILSLLSVVKINHSETICTLVK